MSTNVPDTTRTVLWVMFYLYLTRVWGLVRYIVVISELARGESFEGYKSFDEHFLFYAASLFNNLHTTVNFVLFCFVDGNVRNVICSKLCKKDLDKNLQLREHNTAKDTRV